MSWRDGLGDPPIPAPGASDVAFDFITADEMGEALVVLRRAIDAGISARVDAQAELVDWKGPHRLTYDSERADGEAILTQADVAADLARLRAAWSDAVDAQIHANRKAPLGPIHPPYARRPGPPEPGW